MELAKLVISDNCFTLKHFEQLTVISNKELYAYHQLLCHEAFCNDRYSLSVDQSDELI